jgi:uncharacterized repeat protein (TIGR03803 family)
MALLHIPQAEAATESVVYSFQGGSDGASPQAGLIALKGTLYGTTVVGGTQKDGTVFSLNATTGVENIVYSFCSLSNCSDGKTQSLA